MNLNSYVIGFVFSRGMIEDGGYISKKDLHICYSEVFKYEVDLQIEEIDETNVGQIYLKFENIGVDLIIALGDDASVCLYSYLKKYVSYLPWISLLSSSNFEDSQVKSSVIPKFWFSQDYEMSVLANFIFSKSSNILLNPLKCEIIKIGDSYYSNSLTEKFKTFFELRYKAIVDTNYDSQIAFVAGLGDDEHISKIQSLIEENNDCNQYILTNAAIQNKGIVINRNVKDRCVYCVDVKRNSDKKLQLSIIKLAFEIINDLLKDGNLNIIQRILKIRCFASSEFDESIGFSYDGYLTLPLVVKEVSLMEKDEFKVSKEVYSISINEEKNNYNIAKFISKINESIVLIGNNKEQTPFSTDDSLLIQNEYTTKIINIIKHYFNAIDIYIRLTNNGTRYLSNNDCATESEWIQHIFKESIYCLRKRSLKPIQINLWEEDAPDNEVHRMCFERNEFLVLPLGVLRNITSFNNYETYLTNNQYKREEAVKLNTDSAIVEKFLNTQREQNGLVKYLYIIPCGVSNRKTNSHMVIKTKHKLRFIDIQLLQITVNQLLPIYHDLISKKELLQESIRSAVSAIMARNMSHNLGSHFISNTKNYFGQLADEDNDDQRKKDYRGIKHTLQYIQERMDFIATIVSSDRFPYGPVNVKSQIFDELTPDEFGCRHGKMTTNFLLDFLVYSEAISKGTNEEYSGNKIKLTLNLITKEDNILYRFGATPKNEDKEAKEVFAKKNLAVPGGILGRHAIFTIIENIIRNSSKHDKGRIPSSGLNVSVRLNIDNDHASNIVIFDNKGNAGKVKKNIIELYKETQILEENGSIDKGNKGLKEILISTLWLNGVNLSDWLVKYDSLKDNKESKLEMLGQYLEILSVDSNGEENTTEAFHLGYKIKIKPFKSVYSINPSEKKFILYKDIADVNADIVTADKDYYVLTNGEENITVKTPKLSTVFPRFVESKDDDPVSLMKKSLVKRGLVADEALSNMSVDIIPDNQKVKIKPISKLNKYNIHSSDNDIAEPLKVNIIYKNHLSINESEIRNSLDRYPNAKYIDSISGGDFTHTLTEEFFLEDELNRLKIIESALCKIVIVDERIFNNYAHGRMPQEKPQELIVNSDRVNEIIDFISELKQHGESLVRIASEIEGKFIIKLGTTDLLSGDLLGGIRDALQKHKQQETAETEVSIEYKNYHEFLEKKGIYIYNILPTTGEIITTDGISKKLEAKEKVINSPTFFSIHLSLIESLIKERQLVKPEAEKSVIVRDIMDSLQACFGNPKFMMVHSGRGNLSKELEEELKDKAFMSLSAIEASLYDSKYFLSQLLCSNCYFGKGKINL